MRPIPFSSPGGRRAADPRLLAAAGLWVCFCIASALPGVAHAEADAPPAPVVMVVFDELPTVSLLGPDGAIDAQQYPNFAALAATSTWARNASTVATRLLEAIPAILTGQMPAAEKKAAIRADHPDNLFTWLASTHELHVVEEQSLLRPGPRDAAAQADWLREARRDNRRGTDQVIVFRSFLRDLGARGPRRPDERPTLDFIHVTLPFAPWSHVASGRTYGPARMTGNVSEIWSDEPHHAEDAWRRHLAEARLADGLLGRLVALLKEQRRFDSALFIVTADYGAGFWPGESRRTPSRTAHPEDVLMVPLFVKRPGQTDGEVVDFVVQTIDIVPTVAQVLGLEPGWPVDGCSIFDGDCARPTVRRHMRLDGTASGREIDSAPADLGDRTATLERKWTLFPDLAHLEASWPPGRLENWRGRAIDALPVVESGRPPSATGTVTVDRGTQDWRSERGGPRFSGQVVLAEGAVAADPPWIAFAVNGRLEALAPVVQDQRGRRIVQAMLPEDRLDIAQNALDVFLVSGEGAKAVLLPLELVGRKTRRLAVPAGVPGPIRPPTAR